MTQKSPYLDENIIFKETFSNIKYNTKINQNIGYDIIIYSNGKFRQLYKIENDILNRNYSVFSKFEIDHNTYYVYYISKNYHEGEWKNNIVYSCYENIIINAKYSFIINDTRKIMKILPSYMDKIKKSFLIQKINFKINTFISDLISKSLNKDGFIKTQENIYSLALETLNVINEKILFNIGIRLEDLNLFLSKENYAQYNEN